MDFPIDSDKLPEAEGPNPVERLGLGAVRLASLPFLAIAIALAGLIYGVASLIWHAASLVDGLRCHRGLVRTWDRPIEARDSRSHFAGKATTSSR